MKVKTTQQVTIEFREEMENLLENWDATLEIKDGEVVVYIPSTHNVVTGDLLRQGSVIRFGASFKP